MPLECRCKNAGQSLSTPSRVHRLRSQSIDSNTAVNSLQTSIGTRISLHKTAITVEHKTGPGNTPRYARLKTLNVVYAARRGTLIHYAEAGCKTTAMHSLKSLHNTIARVQRLHNTPHCTSYPEKNYHRRNATASRLYKSPDWVPMNRVNISDQHGLHSLRTLSGIGGKSKLIQEQGAM